MDYFLQNSMILIENNQMIRSSLLSMIANMAIINVPEDKTFGLRCILMIKELLKNKNPEIEESVNETLKNQIFSMLKKRNVLTIPINLFEGCTQILFDSMSKNPSFISSDLITHVVSWINEVIIKLW